MFYSKVFSEDRFILEEELLILFITRWDETELREHLADPVITEHENGIFQYSGLCPEISYKYHRYYASEMIGYDAKTNAAIEEAIATDPSVLSRLGHKYPWSFLRPMHYSDCELYSLLTVRPIIIDNSKQAPLQEVTLIADAHENGAEQSAIMEASYQEDNSLPANGRIEFIEGFRRFRVYQGDSGEFEEFTFNQQQADIIRWLYEAPDRRLHLGTIFDEKHLNRVLEQQRMDGPFRKHPTWRKLIKSYGKGVYGLNL